MTPKKFQPTQKPIKPVIDPEADPADTPPVPIESEDDLDIIPDPEEEFETPGDNDPKPGEGP